MAFHNPFKPFRTSLRKVRTIPLRTRENVKYVKGGKPANLFGAITVGSVMSAERRWGAKRVSRETLARPYGVKTATQDMWTVKKRPARDVLKPHKKEQSVPSAQERNRYIPPRCISSLGCCAGMIHSFSILRSSFLLEITDNADSSLSAIREGADNEGLTQGHVAAGEDALCVRHVVIVNAYIAPLAQLEVQLIEQRALRRAGEAHGQEDHLALQMPFVAGPVNGAKGAARTLLPVDLVDFKTGYSTVLSNECIRGDAPDAFAVCLLVAARGAKNVRPLGPRGRIRTSDWWFGENFELVDFLCPLTDSGTDAV